MLYNVSCGSELLESLETMNKFMRVCLFAFRFSRFHGRALKHTLKGIFDFEDRPVLAWNEFDNDTKYWSRYQGGTVKFLTRTHKDHVIAFLVEEHLKDSVVLDLGCGMGRMNMMYDIKEYHGLDTCQRMLIGAQKLNLGRKNATFHMGDGKTLDEFADNYFDYVICSTVAIHLKIGTFRSYTREAWRVLKPNGIFLVNLNRKSNINPSDFFKQFQIETINGDNVGVDQDIIYKLRKVVH